MMDPALWELLREDLDADRELEAIIRFRHPGVEPPGVRVIARFGTVATCRIRADQVVAVRARDDVVSLKAARLLSPTLETEARPGPATDPDLARPTDVRRDPRLTATGRGVVVAAVDWGVDPACASFRHPPGAGAGTRLLSFWDQRDAAVGERAEPYGYGAVHDAAEIDRALRSPHPYRQLGYHPAIADRGRGTHGTHVLDIAAGNGLGGGPVGLAPESDLVFVHMADRDTGGLANLGDSVRLLEAVHFVARTAGSRPWVVNLSVGRHGGPHNGRTLTELAFDQLLAGAPGRFIVQSAGNYYRSRTHACGTLAPGGTRSFTFVTDPADVTPNELEIWYDGRDELAVRIDAPDGSTSGSVPLDRRAEIVAGGRVVGRVYHRSADPNSGDNHVDAFLEAAGAAGTWTVTLEGRRVVRGRFDAWLERDDACPRCQARFSTPDSARTTTTGTIANSHVPLVVGAYDGHDPFRAAARFSSAGPTRDLRAKPDLSAPGVEVLAARSAAAGARGSSGLLVRKSGTSMATPHVTGSVALCLELVGDRVSAGELRRLLLDTCQPSAVPDPEHRFGRGYLDPVRLTAAASRLTQPPRTLTKGPVHTMPSTDDSVLMTAPATALREVVYRPGGPLARWIDERYAVLARPAGRLATLVRTGDLLLEIRLGRTGGGRCTTLDERGADDLRARSWLRPDQLLLRRVGQVPDPIPGELVPLEDAEDAELDRLVAQGLSENQIANALFYARHPGLSGAALKPGTREARRWRAIRDDEVRPGVRQRLVTTTVDPVQLAVYLSQYENDSRVPEEYTSRFLTGTPLLSMGRSLRDRVLGHWRGGGRPLTTARFHELAMEICGNAGVAALLCHNVAKAFVRGGLAITWRGTGTEGEYTDGQRTHTAALVNGAGRLRYERGGKQVLSIFYVLFSDQEFGTSDPGDWYHFFVTATMTALSSAGTLTTKTGRRGREEVEGADLDPGVEQALGLPTVSAFRFRNTGTTDAANCCAICPRDLGVGAGGTASNGMELRVVISGHRSGIEYDITRTRRDSLWQRVGGVWTRLGSNPMGTNDDHRDTDECLVPRNGRFIFAIDQPGIPALALPTPAAAFDAGAIYPGVTTSAAAQDLVFRLSFAEWVIARSRGEGIPWTPLELPPFRDGSQRRFIFWRCAVWITRTGAGTFVLDVARSRIELGSFTAAVLNAEPV